MSSENSIFIGNRPFMNYVTAIVMQFTTKDAQEVVVRARGKFINRAVDVVMVAQKRFLENKVVVKDVHLDSEEFENDEGKMVRVSTIDVTLARIDEE